MRKTGDRENWGRGDLESRVSESQLVNWSSSRLGAQGAKGRAHGAWRQAERATGSGDKEKGRQKDTETKDHGTTDHGPRTTAECKSEKRENGKTKREAQRAERMARTVN